MSQASGNRSIKGTEDKDEENDIPIRELLRQVLAELNELKACNNIKSEEPADERKKASPQPTARSSLI